MSLRDENTALVAAGASIDRDAARAAIARLRTDTRTELEAWIR